MVYLHGAGAPATCGNAVQRDFLATRGFHFIGPCYAAAYGVGNCGAHIGDCRLEAFDAVDRTDVISIARPDSLEERIIRMVLHLQSVNPQGDWAYYLVDGQPRWNRIIIAGISHGASTAGLIARVRPVARAVLLSGPLDTGQAWLTQPTVTAPDLLWGFSHTRDGQHNGHLQAFEVLQLPGAPTRIEDAGAPWGGSQRLITSVDAGNADQSHSATQAGPRTADGGYVFAPVWEAMYGVD